MLENLVIFLANFISQFTKGDKLYLAVAV